MRRIILCSFVCLSLAACAVGIATQEVVEPPVSSLSTSTPTPASASPPSTGESSLPIITPGATPIDGFDVISPLCDGFEVASGYRNEEVGFELEYPADWHIQGADPNTGEQSGIVVLASWESLQGGFGAIPDGGTKVDIVVFKSGMTLEEAVAQWRQQDENGEVPVTVLSEEKWSLTDGLQAVRRRVEAGGYPPATTIIAVVDEYTVILSGLGDPDLIDAVACTMRQF